MASSKIIKSKEHQLFQVLDHWPPVDKIIPWAEFLPSQPTPSSQLFAYLYQKVKKECLKFPRRRNGKNTFVHPLNVVLYLQKAGVRDNLTFDIGLIHDLIEEKRDLYKKEKRISLSRTPQALKKLEEQEKIIFSQLEQELKEWGKKNNLASADLATILSALDLLTNHKQDRYYHYITRIFTSADAAVQERVIQVKLADRMHNIFSLKEFEDKEKIYQCFKNIFILNQTKEYLLKKEKFLESVSPAPERDPIEVLFKKCAKATYDAFLIICQENLQQGIEQAQPYLQLAFEKYAFQTKGLWEVTRRDSRETHPLQLFQEIIRKYDCRLRHQWCEYERRTNREIDYCHKFFADFNYSKKQLEALINYKDAFALEEIVVRLLYQKDYLLGKFSRSEGFG